MPNFGAKSLIESDQKVFVRLMITIQNVKIKVTLAQATKGLEGE
jgi:hypothetical protein